ncbi:MAG: GNAT family N-acetyltransferase [Candidatus Aureabacteria bacterium]|nr:GNAT family N-acetyltransferase [Candidatus Auribacterota bacterium]
MNAGDVIKIREAGTSDASVLYSLLDHSPFRRGAFNTAPVTMEEHLDWFGKKIRDMNTIILIFEIGSVAFAQCRYEHGGDGSEISVSVHRDYRGKGLGTTVLKMALDFLKREKKDWFPVIAHIKPDNIISLKAFKGAGFTGLSKVIYKENPCFELRKDLKG